MFFVCDSEGKDNFMKQLFSSENVLINMTKIMLLKRKMRNKAITQVLWKKILTG